MEYLATTTKQHQFRILHKKIYLNGGKRADSISDYTAPTLTHAASTQLIKGVNDLIMSSASKMYKSLRAFPDARLNFLINKCSFLLVKLLLSTLYIGQIKDRHMDDLDKLVGEAQIEMYANGRTQTDRPTSTETDNEAQVLKRTEREREDRNLFYIHKPP